MPIDKDIYIHLENMFFDYKAGLVLDGIKWLACWVLKVPKLKVY
jgi:hypothetical protein